MAWWGGAADIAVQSWEWRRMMRQRGGGGCLATPGPDELEGDVVEPHTRCCFPLLYRAQVANRHATVQKCSLHCCICSFVATNTRHVVCVILLHLWPSHLQARRLFGPVWPGGFLGLPPSSWWPEMSSVGIGSVRVPLQLLWSPPFMLSLPLDGCLLIATIQCFLFSMI
jgi:hypothetical protein